MGSDIFLGFWGFGFGFDFDFGFGFFEGGEWRGGEDG